MRAAGQKSYSQSSAQISPAEGPAATHLRQLCPVPEGPFPPFEPLSDSFALDPGWFAVLLLPPPNKASQWT